MTIVIGLTGGIASGKTVVSQTLSDLGAVVIDADKVGHEAYRQGSGCFEAVVGAFGREVVGADGEIDRKALGAKVFNDPEQRRKLEGIVWPWMRTVMERRFAELRAEGVPAVVLEAAVLLEADWVPLVDQVWVVTVPPDLARVRLMERNGLKADQAEARIAAQLTNEERVRRADVVIENDGTLDELRTRVTDEWDRLRASQGAQPDGG